MQARRAHLHSVNLPPCGKITVLDRIEHTLYKCFTYFTGSKIALLTLDSLEVLLGSQGFGVSGSFVQYGDAWTFRTPRGRVPHSERRYARLSRSAYRDDAQSPPMVLLCPTRGTKRR